MMILVVSFAKVLPFLPKLSVPLPADLAVLQDLFVDEDRFESQI
jgi:hypothetical protein